MAKRILEGIRVLDFTVVWSGPYAARMLAEMGADVIFIEHPKLRGILGVYRVGTCGKMASALGMEGVDPDAVGDAPWRGVRDSYTSAFHLNKKFASLDTTKPEGRKLLEELVKQSDVVIENLTPDVVHKIGIGYDQLKDINPRIIKCAMRGFGEGPWNGYSAFGTTMEFVSGITSMNGYGRSDGDQPMRTGVYMVDPLGAMQAVGAIMGALLYRQRTDKGTRVEVSQYEAAVNFVNDAIIEYNMNHTIRKPCGNDDWYLPFQGCYPCQGEDQWVLISVRNKKDWGALCGLIGRDEWLANSFDEIKTNRQEVDVAISSWTKVQTKQEAARQLQSMNIPAGPVNTTPETIYYPPIRYRELYKWVIHPYGGIAPVASMPAKFSKTPFPNDYEPTHAVGGDNDYVYRTLLGLSPTDIKELEEKQIIKA